MKVKYEPHPVSTERKRELRAKGYKIIDARFTPVEPAPSLDLTPEGIDAMDKDTLVELLEAHGVDVDKRKGAATLASELKSVVFV